MYVNVQIVVYFPGNAMQPVEPCVKFKKTAMMGATAFIAAKGQHTSSGSRTVVIIADFIENSSFFG